MGTFKNKSIDVKYSIQIIPVRSLYSRSDKTCFIIYDFRMLKYTWHIHLPYTYSFIVFIIGFEFKKIYYTI